MVGKVVHILNPTVKRVMNGRALYPPVLPWVWAEREKRRAGITATNSETGITERGPYPLYYRGFEQKDAFRERLIYAQQ